MFPHLLKGRVGTRTEIRLPPELTIHKPTNPRRCSSPEEFKWEGQEMSRGEGPPPSEAGGALQSRRKSQADALAPRHCRGVLGGPTEPDIRILQVN